MNDTNRLGWVAAATAVVVAVAAMFGIGWLLARGDQQTGATPTVTASDGVLSPTPTAGPSTPASAAPPGQGDPGQGDSGQGGNGQADPGGPSAGPRIETFRVAQQPTCPGGTVLNPIPGTPVTLEWHVTGADEVTLSIDGPGVYNTYPAEGSDTISFPCAGNEGDTQEHTYLLTAVGDGVTRTDTLTVTATVQEVTDIP